MASSKDYLHFAQEFWPTGDPAPCQQFLAKIQPALDEYSIELTEEQNNQLQNAPPELLLKLYFALLQGHPEPVTVNTEEKTVTFYVSVAASKFADCMAALAPEDRGIENAIEWARGEFELRGWTTVAK